MVINILEKCHSKDQNINGRITPRLVLRKQVVSTELVQDYIQWWAVLLVVLRLWVLLLGFT
jgi:hypothetical protein